MRKLWLVVKLEYQKRVQKKSFILGTLIFPGIFAVIIAATIFIIDQEANTKPLGYVDHSGVLAQKILPKDQDDENRIQVIAYPSKARALEALENGDIQAFQVLPSNYVDTQEVDLYYWDEYPDQAVLNDFNDYVRANLLPEGLDQIQTRIIQGIHLTLQSADGSREFDEDTGFGAVLFPMAVAMFFIFAVMGASGYFLQAITDEKENRTMEITITSISPWQLIAGKSAGLMGVALTQIAIWLGTLYIALLFVPQVFPELEGMKIPVDILVIFILFFVPSFTFIGGIMVAIGGAVTELQEGQQIAGVLNLLFTFPLFLIALVIADPDSPFLVFMSLWPTTSFLTITLRWGLTVIPWWQVILGWLILASSGILTIWVATRIFRTGMLRYGKRLSLKAVFAALRAGRNG